MTDDKRTLRHDLDGYTVGVYFPPQAPWDTVESFFDRVAEDAHATDDQTDWDALPVGLPGDWLGTSSGGPPRVTLDRPTLDLLIEVAGHVSYGRSMAFCQEKPYPDATARRALAQLDDLGLLTGIEPAGSRTDAEQARGDDVTLPERPPVRIRIDLNACDETGHVPVRLADVDGPLLVGDTVVAFEPDDGVKAPALVVRVADGFAYLCVAWDAMGVDYGEAVTAPFRPEEAAALREELDARQRGLDAAMEGWNSEADTHARKLALVRLAVSRHMGLPTLTEAVQAALCGQEIKP